MKFTTACVILMLIILSSCKKESSSPQDPNPNPNPDPAEQKLSLKFIKVHKESKTFELIISDTSGKFLVDTIAPVEEMLTIKFKTNETKYNITTIEGSDTRQNYKVNTYCQVSPKQWALNQRFNFAADGSNKAPFPEVSKITYYNAPKFETNGLFAAQFGTSSSGIFDFAKGIYQIEYRQPNPYYSYLLIPSIKRYRFHETVSSHDSVDLSKMDTAISLVYSKQFELKDSMISVVGFRKKDDISTYLSLYHNSPEATEYDLLYPPTGVEQYLVQYIATDKKNQSYYSFVLDNKVPASMAFLDESYFKLTKKADKDFEIEFPKTLPSFYYFTLYDTGLDWKIYLSTEQTKIQLNEKLVDLRKSKMLSSFNFSLLKTQLSLVKANNYDFTGYLNAIFDPAAPSQPQKIVNYMNFTTKIP